MENRLLSVIIPCYNEEKNICANLIEISRIISEFVEYYEIICVNDGSCDNSEKEIKKACNSDKHIKLQSYDKNKGKGHALKIGTMTSKGELVTFLDCDLELPPAYIKTYIDIMNSKNVDVVIGSKMHKDSKLKYPLNRRILSFGYYLLLKLLFQLKIKDTQTGLKLFNGDMIRNIMKNIDIDGFAFDIEVLALINRFGYKMIDAPIELNFTREHRDVKNNN